MNIDFDSFWRNKIECLLIKSSWVEKVQQRLALDAVSQVWCDHPEWYFWIRGAPGTYSLALADAETVRVEGQLHVQGHFILKCYPYPDNHALTGFSIGEQAAVNSELFDNTQTPRWEEKKRIPSPWFTVGSLTMLLDVEQTVTLLTYDSLYRIRTIPMTVKAAERHGDSTRNNGQPIRNVPGWELGYPFFNCLIGLQSFYCRQAPCFIGATCSPGYEYLLASDQELQCRPTAATQQLALSALFTDSTAVKDTVGKIWRCRLDAEERVIYAATYTHMISDPIKIPSIPMGVVNPLWWDLACAEYPSEKASTCGCDSHEHDSCPLHPSKSLNRL